MFISSRILNSVILLCKVRAKIIYKNCYDFKVLSRGISDNIELSDDNLI